MEGYDLSFHAQGSPEWFAERLGKFTSSEMHCLMVKSKTAGEYFGDGARTYILKKVNELVTGIVEDGKAYGAAIDWGNAHEPEAIEFYSHHTGNIVQPCGFVTALNPMLAEIHGGSPDGLILSSTLIEVKCPYNGENHQKNMALQSVEQFKKLHPKYYTQIQSNLLATEREQCHFISYDPRPKLLPGRLKVLVIYRDEALIKEMGERILAGYESVLQHLENYVHNAEHFETIMANLKVAA